MTGAIPRLVAKSLLYKALDSKAVDVHVKSVEDQQESHIYVSTCHTEYIYIYIYMTILFCLFPPTNSNLNENVMC